MKSAVKYIFISSVILSKIITIWNFYYEHMLISGLELNICNLLKQKNYTMQFPLNFAVDFNTQTKF